MSGVRLAATGLLICAGCQMTSALDPDEYRGAVDGGAGEQDGAASDDDAGPPVVIELEAEDWDTNTPQGERPWVADATAGYSGSGAMLAEGGGNEAITYPHYYTESSRLDYVVELAEGTYFVWVRGIGWSGSDTLTPGVDGSGWANAANPTGALGVPVVDPADWAWGGSDHLSGARITIHVPSDGQHTFNLWLREDGVIVDRIVLATDEDHDPSAE